MAAARRLLAVAALLLLAGAARAYYLPGTYPQEFLIGDVIQGEWTRGAGDCRPVACSDLRLCLVWPWPRMHAVPTSLASARLPCCALQPRSTRWCPLR